MAIKKIFCQEKVINALQLAFVADKVAHAYIFAGPDGVGKFTTAREFAKLLLCKNPVERPSGIPLGFRGLSPGNPLDLSGGDFNDSCGNCVSCRAFEAGSHPDFEHVYKELVKFTREGKDKETPVDFPIDVVREFLIEKASSKPTLSARKVYVLAETEKLNNESQNCLLKILEEPPSYCCIIMTCTRPEKLLPTIRSRCQILRFGPVAEDKIIEKLNESGLGQNEAKFFARFAEGSLGRACAFCMLEQNEANLYQTKINLLNTLSKFEYKDSIELAEKLIKQSKELAAVWVKLAPGVSKTDLNRKASKTIIHIVIAALHDVMLTKVASKESLINFDQPEQIKSIGLRLDAEQAAQKITDCFKLLHYIDSSVNEKLIFESLLLNLAETDKIGAVI